MRRCISVMAAALLVLCSKATFAYVVDAPYFLQITPPSGVFFEVPPWDIPGGWRQLSFSSNRTVLCETPANPLTSVINFSSPDWANCYMTTGSCVYYGWNCGYDWLQNYNGSFTRHLITNQGITRLVSLNHGENKNECIGGNSGNCQGSTNGCTAPPSSCMQNDILPNINCSSCNSGYDPCGVYHECWSAYGAYISLSWQLADAAHHWGASPHNEEGPIVWPANGYTYAGVQSSTGVSHPHGLSVGSYIYVLYKDASFGSGNRGAGIKVARTLKTSWGLSGNWQSYCKDPIIGAVSWVNSLPSGFNKFNMGASYAKQGGCSTPLALNDSAQISTFAVTAKSQGGYLGIAERPGGWALELWQSTDLLNWSFVQTLRTAPSWSAGDIHYPIFWNADGWNNEFVDANNFYIMGTTLNTPPLKAMRVHN